jgi:hypothetical protein
MCIRYEKNDDIPVKNFVGLSDEAGVGPLQVIQLNLLPRVEGNLLRVGYNPRKGVTSMMTSNVVFSWAPTWNECI